VETLLSLAEGSELLQDEACRAEVDLPLRTYANGREFVRRSLAINAVLRPLMARLGANPPDAAILTMMGYWDVVLARKLKRLGVPVVVMVHDAEVHPGDRFHLAVRLQRGLVRMSDGVITLTDFVARQLDARVPLADKVHAVIPHIAFDFREINLSPPRPPEASPDRPLRLLMAGRLKRYKGLQLLADSLALIGDTPFSLRVVGAVDDEAEIAPFRNLPDVTFDLGWKNDRALIAHLDWADVTVLPYIEASQSGIAPMSFKRARPVVATNVGGLPEQVHDGDTGLIAEAGSPESFAAAIQRFAGDRALLLGCAGKALHHATTELSWPALAPRFAAVLEAVARRRG
jgi:glycosyltransferase involved in cell wall biosynthesis